MIRRTEYRVEVLRRGAPWGVLRCSEPPRIDMDATAAITRSMALVAEYDEAVDWLGDAFRPVLILDGVEYPMGVFYAASVRESYTDTGTRLCRAELYDRAYLLSRARTETRLHLSAGTAYTAAVDSLLMGAGVYLRQMTPSAAVLATDREDWEIGTSYLEIINQLLSEINYAPIWFDGSGYAVIGPETDPDAAAVQHILGGDPGTVVTWTQEPVDLGSITQSRWYLDGNGAWVQAASSSRIRGMFIPVPFGAAWVELYREDDYGYYALMQTNSTTNPAEFAGEETGRVRYEGDTTHIDLPPDCLYVWLYVHTANAAGDLMPSGATFGIPVDAGEIQKISVPADTEIDAWNVPNVFIYICDNPDRNGAPLEARAENDSPVSRLSTVRRGVRIPEVVKVDNVPDAATLQTMARLAAQRSALRGQVATVTTPVLPGYGCRDVVAVNHPAAGGIWQSVGWSVVLGPGGVMSHRFQRLVLV